jgi:hypothetical protein
MATLPGEVSEIERQNPNQEHFYIVYQALVLEDIPTETIPAISSPVALIRVPKSLANISLPDIDGCRAVVQDVHSLAALAPSRNILDVLSVPRPHFAELTDQGHLALSIGRHDRSLLLMILIVRGHINARIPR